MSREKQTYNPYCLVSYCHWEATGKVLYCEDCVIQHCKRQESKGKRDEREAD